MSVPGRDAPLRATFALFLALIFSLAPLICIRYCELRHWSLASQAAPTTDTHADIAHHGHGAHHEPQPASHKPPLSEFSQMLRAIVELLPVVALAIIAVVSWLTRFTAMLPPFARGSAPQTPPPRTSRMTVFA